MGIPLDILASVNEPSCPGILMLARPVGLLVLVDGGQRDEKVFAVAERDPHFEQVQSVDQAFPHSLREIEEFFAIYKRLEGKSVEVHGWRGAEEARNRIRDCRERYLSKRNQ